MLKDKAQREPVRAAVAEICDDFILEVIQGTRELARLSGKKEVTVRRRSRSAISASTHTGPRAAPGRSRSAPSSRPGRGAASLTGRVLGILQKEDVNTYLEHHWDMHPAGASAERLPLAPASLATLRRRLWSSLTRPSAKQGHCETNPLALRSLFSPATEMRMALGGVAPILWEVRELTARL